MGRTFLAAVDGSEHGWKALQMAVDFARLSDAGVVVVHVVPREPMPEGMTRFAQVEGLSLDELQARRGLSKAIADQVTTEAEQRIRECGIEQFETRVAEGHASTEIIALAESTGADMVFLGSRGLGDAQSLLMGSTSHKVMHLAPCTCVAVK